MSTPDVIETPAPTQSLANYMREENSAELKALNGVPPAEPVSEAPRVSPEAGTVESPTEPQTSVEPERNADGTFKAKPKDDGKDPRKSIQAKIDAEVKRRGEAERRAEAAEKRAADLEAQYAAKTPEATSPVSTAKPPTYTESLKRYMTEPGWPKLEQFQDFEDPYAATVAAQSAYVQTRQRDDQAAQTTATEAQRSLQQRMVDANTAGQAKYPEWDELLKSEAASIQLSEAITTELYKDATLSADLIHRLLTDDDVMIQAAAITDPIAARMLIKKLSVGLSAASSGPAVKPQAVTKAKPMIKPVMASLEVPEATPPDELPFGAEYLRRMNAEDRKREAL